MIAGVRRGLRAASIFLLGVAAPILLCSSAVAQPVAHAKLHLYQPVLTTAVRLHAAPRACSHVTPPATCRPILFHLMGRAFAEDAPPPPSEAPEAAQLLLPLEPAAMVRASSPPLRSNAFCVCNRQRAP